MDVVLYSLGALALVGAVLVGASARVVQQIERGVVFRLGRAQPQPRPPGFTMLIPVVDRMKRVNMQVVTLPVPAQDGITRDNVTVRVDAVVYYRVIDPIGAVVQVQDYAFAIAQVAQTSLRSIIGKSELDDLLSNREKLNQGLEVMLDSPAAGWGIEIDRVEIKDVALPDSMKRSMSRQAEAERERRSRVITADGEFQASQRLSQAASVDGRDTGRPAAAAAADDGGGGGREELDPRAPVPGRDAALLRGDHGAEPNDRPCDGPTDEPDGHPGRTRPSAPVRRAERVGLTRTDHRR